MCIALRSYFDEIYIAAQVQKRNEEVSFFKYGITNQSMSEVYKSWIARR